MAALYGVLVSGFKRGSRKRRMLDALPAEFERFHGKYVSLMHGYYSAMSREVSSMIAGPSKFRPNACASARTGRIIKAKPWRIIKSVPLPQSKGFCGLTLRP